MARTAEKPLEHIGGKKRLSETELQFMEVIWEHPEGISSEEIYRQFPQARGTKSTILYNISEKGYVWNHQEGLHHIYIPLVTKLEYEQALICQELEKTFGSSSFERLVAAFCGREKLTEKQKERVQKLLDEIKEET